MLKYHGNKEEMWKVAAYWEFLHCRNVETARGFLLTGMRHHPESQYIYSEVYLFLFYTKKKQNFFIFTCLGHLA